MTLLFLLILVSIFGSSRAFLSDSFNYSIFSFTPSPPCFHTKVRHFDSSLKASLTKRIYKEIRKRIQRSRETVEQRRLRLDKEELGRRDGLLQSPKTSYEIYIAADIRPLDQIRDQFGHILSKLKKIGAENIHIYNIGTKTLVRPIKKRYEANFLLINLTVYPSLINHIRLRLVEELGVLRVLILRDDEADKQRRLYRDSSYYVRHPFFNKELYKPFLERLKDSPYV